MPQLAHSLAETRPVAPVPARPSIDVGVDKLTDDLNALLARLGATNLYLSLHLVESFGLAPGLAEGLLRHVIGGQGRITQISPYDYVVTLLGPDELLLRGDRLPARLAAGLSELLGPDTPALGKVHVRSLSTWTHDVVDPSWLLNELGNAPGQPLRALAAA
jgi:hypothetical protein